MQEERRVTSITVVALSTIVPLLIGVVGILTFIQSGERRTTQMEVKLEVLIKEIEGFKQDLKADRRETRQKDGGKL